MNTQNNTDPYVRYAYMRANSPVCFNSDLNLWEVFGYRDIQSVLGDPETFSSDISALQTMATMDPPRHTQLRRLVARAFTSKLISALEPRIQEITNELLSRVESAGAMDVITDLAFPLPIAVIAELLGLPQEDRGKFKQWSIPAIKAAEMELQGLTPEPAFVEAVSQLEQYLQALVELRTHDPREDLISGLAHAEVEGERLTMQEIVSTCRLLLIAGFETTANLIGNTAQLLLAHPLSLAAVRDTPELIPGAIEESLRYNSPFQFFMRKATRDVSIGGQLIREGQRVLTINASGNRDEAAFPDADRFDIRRSPNRHLSFGHGIHLCLGAGLGRLEAKVAIGTLLNKFPDLQLDTSGSGAASLSSVVLYGWSHLPIRWG
jgi:cytochrome P450 family 109